MKLRALMLLLMLSAGPALADVTGRVAVVAYQGGGKDPEVVSAFAEALRATLTARAWPVVPSAETERQARAATMCGEDVECLSTIGQRVDARWVLAFGVGRVGATTLLSALLVDASTGLKLGVFTESFATAPADLAPLAGRTCDALFAGLKPPTKLAPPEPPPAETPPLVTAPTPPAHRVRPWAIGTAIGAGALAAAGITFTILAQQHFAGLPDVPLVDRPAADSAQRAYNLTADVLVGTAIAAGVTSLVLFLVDAREGSTP